MTTERLREQSRRPTIILPITQEWMREAVSSPDRGRRSAPPRRPRKFHRYFLPGELTYVARRFEARGFRLSTVQDPFSPKEVPRFYICSPPRPAPTSLPLPWLAQLPVPGSNPTKSRSARQNPCFAFVERSGERHFPKVVDFLPSKRSPNPPCRRQCFCSARTMNNE